MTIEQSINHWVTDSDKDFNTMLSMFKSKHYTWCLFVGHLSLEKLLKAKFIQVHKNVNVPKIHDLLSLAIKCNIEPNSEQENKLDLVTSFNLATRYQDQKLIFHRTCTAEFAKNKPNSSRS